MIARATARASTTPPGRSRPRAGRRSKGPSSPTTCARASTILAARGLLRSYLLRVAGEPCAFVIGYQWQSEFHYIRIAYDPKFAKLSPGTALLYLLLEELCAENRVALVSLGAGDFGYKAQFGNVHVEIGDVWLLRRTLRNRILRQAHGRFRDAVVAAREWVRARKARSAGGAAEAPAPKPAT